MSDLARVRSSDLSFFLDRCRNLAGRPITAHNRARLSHAVDRPGLGSWDDAYGVILNDRGMTLWIAVMVIQGAQKTAAVGDPHRGGRWVNLPSAREVAAGIRFATS